MSGPWAAAVIALWCVVILLTFAVLGVLRRISGVLEVAESRLRSGPVLGGTGGLEIGERVEPFSVRDSSGTEIRSDALYEDGAVLVFMGWECEPCQQLAASLREPATVPFKRPVLAILSDDERSLSWDLGRAVPLYQLGGQASAAFANIATPQGFAVDALGVVKAKSIVNSAAAVEALVRSLE
jgi:hypothetical protein